MRFKLQVFKVPHTTRSYKSTVFRFAVVDKNKTQSYPGNFVCMLPMRIVQKARPRSTFVGFFGDRSVEVAKQLLHEALETEQESDVKTEINRRLLVLEPKLPEQIRCRRCGKFFEPKRAIGYKSLFCTECLKRKYGR